MIEDVNTLRVDSIEDYLEAQDAYMAAQQEAEDAEIAARWHEAHDTFDELMLRLYQGFGRPESASQCQTMWIPVKEAARIGDVDRGTVTRWADKGLVKSNGIKGRARKIDLLSLLLFLHKRKERERRKGYEDYSRELDNIPEVH
jgi:hypothetical protein